MYKFQIGEKYKKDNLWLEIKDIASKKYGHLECFWAAEPQKNYIVEFTDEKGRLINDRCLACINLSSNGLYTYIMNERTIELISEDPRNL